MRIREAVAADAEGIAEVLHALVVAGRRRGSAEVSYVIRHYLEHPDRLGVTLAAGDDGTILGFQSLKCSSPGNPYDTPDGWGIIGTHVRPSAERQGVGRALFAASEAIARAAGLKGIEASIGNDNPIALAYYGAIGFHDHGKTAAAVCKRLALTA